jgi:hypothetical protein
MCKHRPRLKKDNAYGEVGVYGLLVDDGDACVAACAMILLVFKSLKDLCFLLVAFPARWPKLSRCERVLLEENIVLTSMLVVLPQGRQTKSTS